jgi:hypothetical protein
MKIFIKSMLDSILLTLPQSSMFDKLVGLINFYRAHRRFPSSDSFLINDIFFKIKVSKEIISPIRVFTSDKELVKNFITATVGEKYNVPTIAVLYTDEQIDNFNFPDSCCIKPTHASGRFMIRDKANPINIEEIKDWLKINYHKESRERNYKDLIPKIIVEPLIFNSTNIQDYKFFCNNGIPKFIQVDSNRASKHTRCLYTTEWVKLDFSLSYPMTELEVSKPHCLEKMLDISRKISKFFSCVRIDFYTDGYNCYVGEITHCPESSNGRFIPPESEYQASQVFLS